MNRKTIPLALSAVALGLAACGTAGTTSRTPAEQAYTSTACPGINCTEQVPAPANAGTTGPLGTTFTVADYGPNGTDATYKIRLMQVIDPAKIHPESEGASLSAGSNHAAALKFYVEGVTGANNGPDPALGVQATGTDGKVFFAGEGGALDRNVYVSSSASSLMAGEHGIWWDEVDLPAGVHVRSVRYLAETIYTPRDATPVTWTTK